MIARRADVPKTFGLAALGLTSLAALILCPHSKVEESFNLQATHDLYYHGVFPALSSWWGGQGSDDPLPYDHLKYPGVVPRTFAGPFILAYASRFIGFVASPLLDLAAHPMLVQALSRLLLLMFNLHALLRLADSANRKLGHPHRPPLVGGYFLLVTASQFHLPFYCSRMLPNVFALGLVVHGYADWMDGKAQRTAAWLVVASAVFRCDVLILLFTVGLALLLRRELSPMQAIATGVLVGAISLALTVPLDSILWERPLWPEGEVLFFNAVENKSSDWGTSPWHWYFSSALPKSMLLTVFLIPLSILRIPEWAILREMGRKGGSHTDTVHHVLDSRFIPFVVPILCFVGLYSILPHKEMRFIFPALPMLNVAAAHGLTRLHEVAFPLKIKGKDKDRSRAFSSYSALFLFVCGIGCVLVTLAGSEMFLAVSTNNYPGGDALAMLQKHVEKKPSAKANNDIVVHIDVASAMSGVSLFGQRSASYSQGSGRKWTFSKAGYEEENEVQIDTLQRFTHLLSEDGNVEGFHEIGVALGNPRIDLRRFRISSDDAIYVLERKGWGSY